MIHSGIRRAAIRAMRTGEAVTLDILATITLSFTSEREYAKVVRTRAKQERRAERPQQADVG